MEPLDFGGDTKMKIYECGSELATLRWKRYIPGTIASLIFVTDLYKILFLPYTGFIWFVLPIFPIAMMAAFQRNIN